MPAPSYALTNYTGTSDPAGDILTLIETRLTAAGWTYIEQASFTQGGTPRYMRVWKCPGTQNISTVDFYIGLVKNQAAGTYLAARVFEGYNSGTHLITRPCVKGDQNVAPQGTTWTARSMSVSVNYQQIVFGNGLFLATGDGSANYSISTDGINWVTKVYPSSSAWRQAVYGNGVWVAVSNSTNVAASTADPNSTWTARTLPSSMSAKALAYGNPGGNPIFVCLSSNGNSTVAASSTDGATWVARTLPAPGPSTTWNAVAYGNGVFIAVANNVATTVAARSTDGINWSPVVLPSGLWNGVVYGAGTWVAVGNNNVAATSTDDGATWQARSMPVAAGGCVTYGNGMFVAGSSSIIASSPDGIAWTIRPQSPNSINTVAYGAGLFVGHVIGTTASINVSAMDLTYPYHAGVQTFAADGSTIPGMVDVQTTTNLVVSTNYDVGILASNSYLVVGVNTLGTTTQVFTWILGLYKPIAPESQAVYPPVMAIGDIRAQGNVAANGVSRAIRVAVGANAFGASIGPESVLLGTFPGASPEPASNSIRASRVFVAGSNGGSNGWALAYGGKFHGWLYDCVAVNTGTSATVIRIGDTVTIGGRTYVAFGQSNSGGLFMAYGACAFFWDTAAGS
jgi:hypothetical protein